MNHPLNWNHRTGAKPATTLAGWALLFGVLLAAVPVRAAMPDFTQAIRYTAPTNFYGGVAGGMRTDPGDNPFSLEGPDVLSYKDRGDWNCGDIMFRFGLVSAYVGEGKVIKYLPVTATTLEAEMNREYQGKFPQITPATAGRINGFDAVSLTASRPPGGAGPYYFYFCWIPVETNIALKITAVSCNADSFKAMTNSMQSIRIDKRQVLALLQPRPPHIATSHLDKVEVGYMQWRGRRTAAFVFRSKGRIFSFAAADGGKPEDTVKSSLDSLGKMRDLSRQPDVLRMAFVDSGRTGDGPEDYQTVVNFFAETNAAAIAELKRGEYHGAPLLMMWESWTNREPEAFQKVGEYDVNGTLLMRKED